MDTVTLIADSGATKAEWCLINKGRKRTLFTQGISPYFLNKQQIIELLQQELMPGLKRVNVETIHYYGTGCANPDNALIVKSALKSLFKKATVKVNTDLLAAARATCGHNKGIACILWELE